MKFGVTTFMTDEGIRPAPLAKALDERGFDSLLVHDHSHVPVTRETPFPGDGELPRVYYRTLDPFVALTAAATVTDHLLLDRDEAEFHGEFVDFDPIFCWPKPVQRPHPPIYIGGDGPAALARVAALGTAGAGRVALALPTQPEAETLRTLDAFAALVSDYR